MASKLEIARLLSAIKQARVFELPKLWADTPLRKRAAVCVLLTPQMDILLTTRSKSISYANDTCLPGGKAEMNESFDETASRELFEEVGIKANQTKYLGYFSVYMSSKLHLVVPNIYFCEQLPHISADRAEVTNVFTLNLEQILNYKQEIMPQNLVRPRLTELMLQNNQHAEVKLWGLTANILIDLARVVYQRQPQFDFYRNKTKFIYQNSAIGNLKLAERLYWR